MNEGHLILAAALVVQGCYIMYQHSLITRYKRTLMMATYALQSVYYDITRIEDEEDTD